MGQVNIGINGVTPPPPSANEVILYAKSDKRFYMIDDSGAEVKLLTNEAALSNLVVQTPLVSTGGSSPTLSINTATTTTNGIMVAADKVKLNNSTSLATPNTLIARDASGNFAANEITASTFNGNATSVTTVPILSGAITTTGTTNATTLGTGVITNTNISNTANIAISKLAVNPTLRSNHTGVQDANTLINLDVEVANYLTTQSPIVDDMIASNADIAITKLAVNPLARGNHTGTQLVATLSDFDTQVTASINDYLISTPLTNDNIAPGAAIELTKLASNPLQRANHTGTQLASTISNFNNATIAALSSGDGIDITTGGVISAKGTLDRISVDINGIDIASSYIGQNSITTVGTITSGTWNGTIIPISSGGTGAASPGQAANKLLAVNNTSASINLGSSDNVVLVNATGAVRTITLPSASTLYKYVIKKVDSSSNNVIIAAAGGNLIEGTTTKTLTTQYDYLTLVSDGTTNWYIVS